jgi:hypothetical protein
MFLWVDLLDFFQLNIEGVSQKVAVFFPHAYSVVIDYPGHGSIVPFEVFVQHV